MKRTLKIAQKLHVSIIDVLMSFYFRNNYIIPLHCVERIVFGIIIVYQTYIQSGLFNL